MNFTKKRIAEAKSAEELIALAKAEGIALTEEEAKKYFADLHKEGELSDDELDNVSGGGVSLDAELDDATLNLYATAKDNATSANTSPAGFSHSDNGAMKRTSGRF